MPAASAQPAKPPLWILIAAFALGPLALNIFMPSMARLPEVFDTDYGTVQLTLSLFLIGMAGSQLVYGPLSDRFGRRPLMLVGVVLFVVGSVIGLVAPTIEILLLGRLVQAIGGCAGMVLGRAIVRDTHGRDQAASAIAYLTMAMVVAPMLAPALGGFLDNWFGWRAAFAVVTVFGAAVLAAVAVGLPETNQDRRPLPALSGMAASYWYLLRSAVFRAYALHLAFTSAGFFAFLGGAPYVTVELMGRSTQDYGLYFIPGAIGYMAGNYAAARLSVRLGIDRMILLGGSVTLAGGIAGVGFVLAGWLTPLTLFGPMVVFAFGNGLSLPNGNAGAISVNPHMAGAASGLAGFLQMSVGAASSILVGHLLTDSALPMTLVMAGTAALAILFFVMIMARARTEQASQPVPGSR
ncbi:MAG: multidrug effflux MFS transporter [Inquilinaceae bacterium]